MSWWTHSVYIQQSSRPTNCLTSNSKLQGPANSSCSTLWHPTIISDCTPPFEVYVYSDSIADTIAISRGKLNFSSCIVTEYITNFLINYNSGKSINTLWLMTSTLPWNKLLVFEIRTKFSELINFSWVYVWVALVNQFSSCLMNLCPMIPTKVIQWFSTLSGDCLDFMQIPCS